MSGEVSDYKQLAGGVEFVSAGDIPRSPAGKILRRVLRDKFIAGEAPSK